MSWNDAAGLPGVYVEEVPSGHPAIAATPTSVAAFVGPARRGRLDSPVEVSSLEEFTGHFGGVWRRSELAHAMRAFFAGGGRRAVVVRIAHPDCATARLDVGGLRLVATSPGRWANRLQVTVSHPSAVDPDAADAAADAGVAVTDLVTLEVTERRRQEIFRHVAVTGGHTPLSHVLASSRLVRADGPPPRRRPDVGVYAVARTGRGSNGSDVDAEDYVGAGLAADHRGLFALDATDDVSLICLPPPSRGGDLPESVWPAAAAYALARGAMLLVDPPASLTPAEAAAWPAAAGLAGAAARNTAVYFPRVREAGRPGRPDRIVAASGAVAGVIARTDVRLGVWKAPGGQDATLAGATGLAHDLDPASIELLTAAGVNTLKDRPGRGPLVWGARTLAGSDASADEARYLPVRRLLLHLERSLERGLTWTAFEPNDEPLWASVRAATEAFLLSLFRQGALMGSSPHEAYAVHCGRNTTSQADLDRGVARLVVAVAPIRPSTFLTVSLELRTASPP